MVEIRKQSPNPASNGNLPDILKKIKPVQARSGGIKLAIYGRAKSGKTRLACSFPKPMLLVGTEDGTQSVATVPNLDFVQIASSDDLGTLIEHCKSSRKYQTICLDTAGGLERIILKEVLGLTDIPLQKGWGMTDKGTWGVINTQCTERLDKLLNLNDTLRMNVIIIAHEREFKTDGMPTDMVKPHIGAALSPGTATWLEAAVDNLCQTYIRDQVKITKIAQDDGTTIDLEEPTGKKEYCIRTGPHSYFRTGFRCAPNVNLPDAIVNPDYGKILEVITGKKPEVKKPLVTQPVQK
jgi:hypothetical protein